MSPALDTMPPGTKAAILRDVLGLAHSYEKGALAARYSITLAQLQTLIDHHGGTNRDAMQRHITELSRVALERESNSDASDLESQSDTPSPVEVDQAASDGEQHAPATTGQLVNIPVNRLISDPENPRDELTDIEDLADSIKEVGLLEPVVARTHGPQLIIVAGHRRVAAVRLLRWTHVDTIIKPSMKSDHVLAAMLIENNQRVDLDKIEEARALLKLKVQRNCSDSDLGAMIGRSVAFVSTRLALLNLTPEQQAEVRAGTMKLAEATYRGRQNAGKLMTEGQQRGWHLGPAHALANQAKARCKSLKHSTGRTVGGMACGECWEFVIRTNERVTLVERSVRNGQCDTCGSTTATVEDQEHAHV